MAPKKKIVCSGEVPYFGLTKFLVIKLALPHVCLWSLSTLYCIGGALVFMQLERRETFATSQYVNRTSRAVTWQLYNLTRSADGSRRVNESEWKAIGEEALKLFTGQIYDLHQELGQPALDAAIVDKWAFGRAFFFSATTLTSIGYGNQTPSTKSGKIFCIFFALFGLPLVVITIADIAKFLSHFILWCFMNYLMLKWHLRNRLRAWHRKREERRESLRLQRVHGLSAAAADSLVSPKGQSDEEVAEFLWVNLENAEFVEVPASLMFTLIILYVALGGLYFRSVERGWTFFEGFYFSLISILAIGFGDYTPRNERYIYLSLLYVIFGIVLTTCCIDIVGVGYINRLHFWGRQLHKVDPLLWLKEVQEKRLRNMKRKAMAALINTLTALHYMRLDPALLNNAKGLLAEQEAGDDGGNAANAAMTNLTPAATSNREDDDQAKNRSPHQAVSVAVSLAPMPSRPEPKVTPASPRNFHGASISVHSVTLKWEQPLTGATEDTYYSLSYKLRSVCDHNLRRQGDDERNPSIVHDLITSAGFTPTLCEHPAGYDFDRSASSAAIRLRLSCARVRRPASFRMKPNCVCDASAYKLAPRRADKMGVEHLPSTSTTFTVSGLKSFALYQFSLAAVNKNGRSRSVHTQEYTEPSTVPLNIRAACISDTMAKVVWDPPARNKFAPRRYTVHVSPDANRPFSEWQKIETAADEHQIDLLNLEPKTTYTVCVSANHNRGLAIFSRSLQLVTLASPIANTDTGVGEISKEESIGSPAAVDSMQVSSPEQSTPQSCWSSDVQKSETGTVRSRDEHD